jgi:hypothetical protein
MTETYVNISPTGNDTSYSDVWKCDIITWDGEGVDALNGTETIEAEPGGNGGNGGGGGGRGRGLPKIVCGNGICESNATFAETFLNCPQDCLAEDLISEILRRLGAASICGNGICEVGENSISCAADCPITCGNSICEAGEIATCPKDCVVENILFSVDIVHTRDITLFYNFTKSTVIAVNNKGNAPITGLYIATESLDGFTFEILPLDIDILQPGDTAFFFINMKSLIPDDFQYIIFVESDQLAQKEILNIHIVRRIPTLRDLLNDEFGNLEQLYDMLEEETKNRKDRGYDVTTLETELANAKIILDDLDICLKQEDISACNTTMDRLRNKLSELVELLTALERITAALIKIPETLAEYLLWALFSLLILLLLVLRWYLSIKARRSRRRRHRRR